ncbi:MAG TPA: PKD domain-containing protein, partial [Methanomicrobiales archaeon]|nr:PKD domain-containing protein [Methanomicrobiales archaeon]
AVTPFAAAISPHTSPVASFIEDPITGTAPLPVQFTDLSSGSPTSWAWDFGDGEKSTEQNPLHTFAAPGDYAVSLTVSNAAGSNTSASTDRISVTSLSGSQTPLSPVAPLAAVALAILLGARRIRPKR